MNELAAGRVRPIGGPEPDAIGTAELVVQQSDCASDLKVNNAPDEKFPPVFATTRMIALTEMAGARVLKPLLQSGEMSVGVTSISFIPPRLRSGQRSPRLRIIEGVTENYSSSM